VEAAGDFVGVVVELPARVELGHHDLRGGAFLLVVLVDLRGNARPLSMTLIELSV